MIADIVRVYLELYPGDKSHLELLLRQIKANEDLSDRRNFQGHITGSGIILSPDNSKVLLINHPSQKRWQQPGGHWDKPEAGPWETAERESKEETGVKIAKRINAAADYRIPLSINSHKIMAYPFKDVSKREPDHYHHDFRYLFIAKSESLGSTEDVVKEAKWYDLEDPKASIIQEELIRASSLLKQLKP